MSERSMDSNKSKQRTLKGAVGAGMRAEIPAMKRIYERKKQGQPRQKQT